MNRRKNLRKRDKRSLKKNLFKGNKYILNLNIKMIYECVKWNKDYFTFCYWGFKSVKQYSLFKQFYFQSLFPLEDRHFIRLLLVPNKYIGLKLSFFLEFTNFSLNKNVSSSLSPKKTHRLMKTLIWPEMLFLYSGEVLWFIYFWPNYNLDWRSYGLVLSFF